MPDADPIPTDAFYDLSLITDLAISPDGDRVAFTADEFAPDEDERLSSLFVVPTDASEDPHRLTRLPGAGSPRWSPDGTRLAFLASRDEDAARRIGRDDEADDEDGDGDGDENGNGAPSVDDEPKPQVWVFDLERGGDASQVTDHEEGVQGFDWGPDGNRLVVESRDPTEEEQESLKERREGGPIETERLQHKLDGAGYLDTVTRYLFVVDLAGDAERLDDAYGGGAFEGFRGMEPRWGPDGRIAFTSCRLDDPDDTFVRDLYAISPDGENLTKLTDSDLDLMHPRWSPGGDRLAFVGRDPTNWCIPAQVYVHDGDDYRSLTAGLDRTLSWYSYPQWADEETLYATIGDEGLTRLVRVTLDADVERVFEAQDENRAMRWFDIAGDTATFGLSHPSDGQDVFAVDADDLTADDADSIRRLSAVNADLVDEYPMPSVRRITYASDGYDVDGIVYFPDDVDPDDPETDPLPLVVGIHGGPISYDEPEFDFVHAAFASRGYAVLRPNYRGGSSYGREFAETLRGKWGSVEVEDIVAGVDEMVDRGWADPDRVFGYGFSYGGIAQGHLVTQTDVLTAAVPEHGIYDLRSDFGAGDSHLWMEDEFGLPWENPEAYDEASSITEVGNLDTPLLVMAGDRDWRCPPHQSEQLYVSAKKQGVDAKLVRYTDEHHNIADPDRAVHRLDQILGWYERYDPAVDEGESGDDSTIDEDTNE